MIAVLVLVLGLAACFSIPDRQWDGNFSVELSSPNFPAGEIETQIKKTFPMQGLRKILVNVSYYPLEDAVLLYYRSDFFMYNQFWDRNGREAFLTALEKYNEDYNARNLSLGSRASVKAYGNSEGFLIWQMQSLTKRAMANMDIELGYLYNQRSPYFAVTQKMAQYKDNITKDNDMNSQEISMHFTRAQAQELALLFDQDYLKSIVPSDFGRRTLNPHVETDDY